MKFNKYIFGIFFIGLFLSECSVSKSIEDKVNIEEIIVYSLPQYSHYPLKVRCGEIKTRDPKITKIANDSVINDFTRVLFEENNMVYDSRFTNGLDCRMLIEFKKGDEVVRTICWTNGNYLEIAGKVFKGNDKIENLLLDNKLIYKIILDE